MNQKEMMKEIRRYARRNYDSTSEFLTAMGISRSTYSAIGAGIQSPSKVILEALGYEKVVTVTFEKISDWISISNSGIENKIDSKSFKFVKIFRI